MSKDKVLINTPNGPAICDKDTYEKLNKLLEERPELIDVFADVVSKVLFGKENKKWNQN